MIESTSAGETGIVKFYDKKAHFKEGAIDFTAGSLGKHFVQLTRNENPIQKDNLIKSNPKF